MMPLIIRASLMTILEDILLDVLRVRKLVYDVINRYMAYIVFEGLTAKWYPNMTMR